MVRDVVLAANHCRDARGFPPTVSGAVRRTSSKRDGLFLVLGQASKGHVSVPHWRVDENSWNVHLWVSAAAALLAGVRRRGARSGYDVACGQPIAPGCCRPLCQNRASF
ncbi:MAG: hypothetical protein ACOZE5_07195 [Verrucomicrobiota bacterium]